MMNEAEVRKKARRLVKLYEAARTMRENNCVYDIKICDLSRFLRLGSREAQKMMQKIEYCARKLFLGGLDYRLFVRYATGATVSPNPYVSVCFSRKILKEFNNFLSINPESEQIITNTTMPGKDISQMESQVRIIPAREIIEKHEGDLVSKYFFALKHDVELPGRVKNKLEKAARMGMTLLMDYEWLGEKKR